MDTQKFMSLTSLEKVEIVNKMLKEESFKHLENVAKKLGMSTSTFSKIMRDNSSYQYNQTTKQYDRLLTMEEYRKYRQSDIKVNSTQDVLHFLEEHLDELKHLMKDHSNQLILDPVVYDPTSKNVTRTFQVNAAVFDQFSKLCAAQFPHLRQKDIVSMCLLEFTKKYQKAPSE